MANELESAINEVKSILQPLFSKPKLSSKLLSKPPFRFIHDIVTSTLDSTGFPNGLFEPIELQSSTYKDDKAAKLSFLDKLIHLINVGGGRTLEVSSSKIVAGLEPLSTNILLANFGRLAVNQDLDRSSLIQQCRDGQRHSTPSTPPTKVIEETEVEMAADDALNVSIESNLNASRQSLNDQIRACNEDIEQTIQMISRIVSKPKCTEKLLSKPPFRFLHDLFVAIAAATEFDLGQVFSYEEMQSGNIKEKQQKLEFLDKLIRFLSSKTGLSIDVKSIKIVAGLEAERTRFLLQVYSVVVAHETSSDISEDENLIMQASVDVSNEIKADKNEDGLMKTEVELETVSSAEIPMNDYLSPAPVSLDQDYKSPKANQMVSFKSSPSEVAKIDVGDIADELDDQSLPDFDEWLAAESGEIEGFKPTKPGMKGMTLRLKSSASRPSSSLMLTSKFSSKDLESIAAAVEGITELANSLGHSMGMISSDMEVMNRERTYWSEQMQTETA